MYIKILITLVFLTLNLNASEILKKDTSNIEFNITDNDYNIGCLGYFAEIKNKKTTKVEALFYSINHELWRIGKNKKKKFAEPTLKTIQNDILSLCNSAASNKKNIEFMLYQRAIKNGMKANRFFDIIDYIDNHKF